ncbi:MULTISPECIES: glycoside hydrolase family 2 protein [unclassified Oceanispirochaeta]|uniref:beta-mannosidase n=1 Tax=unclassified Oceanispirochaeta TaxID=2635722 RepID=UPI000E08D334|nr:MULTISPECIES: glycoside hydrolase family 2 protein [unclassified Oceanispirochaeta]MBF9016608.1 glycoside hydrolase family 2 protein [Oceanispirochaeta sp. M2]NPD73071.1 glycoside hydrolase family 2 protein [Oceanispirochaeta sp. M1]RDG31416.1 glycoside hydrolase family 2 protein [Oceanispirochaeta sp. M1]
MNHKRALKQNWILSCPEHNISLPVEIPSTVFESLLDASIIEDPFYGDNEKSLSWVYESQWNYSSELVLEKEDLDADELILRFHGLDTLAAVNLNGKILGQVDNMHRCWEFNLLKETKDTLVPGTNTLEIEFRSSTAAGRAETRRYGRNLREFPFFMKSPTLRGASYIRKALYSFGWDWGPQLPDTGIWREVEIERIQGVKLINLQSCQTHSYTDAHKGHYPDHPIEKTELRVRCESENPSGLECHISLDGPGFNEKKILKDNEVLFEINNPSLWWTWDLGEAVLYELKAEYYKGEQVVDQIVQKIGLRDLKLIRDKDRWGETFYFSLNGVPLFARGSNWIPVDSFIPRGKKAGLYEKRIQDALDANMNMLRVWGGGIYEENLFYDLCDEKGLLVWQDFMFACMPTPKHPAFYDSVIGEASDNIRRLRHHSCLALWVGNNEIEGGWKSLFYWLRFPRYKKSYLYLFEDLLSSLVQELDSGREYWPSSPSSGGSFKNPESENSGDSHFWSVWHGGKPFSAYREHYSRFMSEFGFESFPGMKTISSFAKESDWSFHSNIMENHQKNVAGNKKILKYMKKRFSIPASFEDQVTLSQITQAEAMEYGVDHWRRNRQDYRCMGALYWQINDCWPVASWSSVDYYGRWKALHYFAKRFNSPIYCNASESDSSVEIWGVNDRRQSEELTLEWSLCDVSGKVLRQGKKDCIFHPADSALLEQIDLENGDERQGILFYSLWREDKPFYRGMKLLKAPVKYHFNDPGLSWKSEEKGGSITVTVKAEAPAVYVHWRSDIDGNGSDNYFSLMKDEEYSVEIKLWNKAEKELFLKTLIFNSLYDIQPRDSV